MWACACLLLIYMISISILCVSQEWLSLTEFNKQIRDFCKWLILEKQRYNKINNKYIIKKQIFNISERLIQCNKDSCCEHITGAVNIYLCVGLLSLFVLCVYLFVCVISNQSASKSHVITPTVIWRLVTSNTKQGASGTKVTRLNKCKYIIPLRKTLH